MYELCAREPPFNARTHFHLVQKIKDGRVEPLPSIYSPELQGVIKSCLKTNPLLRPDTAQLLNLPMIRLLRKEAEVVELGKTLKATEELARAKLQEAEAKALSLECEKARIEAMVRREWEVKARLEIDRQVQMETEKLQKKFDGEVQARVEKEVRSRLEVVRASKDPPPPSPADILLSSIGPETDFPSSTDLSMLSLESPSQEQPSRVSSGKPNSKNIFARVAAEKVKLNPIRLPPSPPPSLGPAMEIDEDSLIELSSPIRGLVRDQDAFKAPGRPPLMRQKTAPTRRLSSHPTIFNAPSRPPGRIPSPDHSSTASGSPVRKVALKPIATGENDMFKAVTRGNFLGNGGGRTLVELQQAKTGGTGSGLPAARLEERDTEGEREGYDIVPLWDPERDEMPSPFLVRGAKGLRRL